MPETEPFSAPGGPHGALVLHGFTGNPSSVRPLAEGFAAAGFAVELPRLPGHGTSLDDMLTTRFADWSAAAEEAYLELAGRCDAVVVAGLSMGATLCAWLATRHQSSASTAGGPSSASTAGGPSSASTAGGPVAGMVAVNGMFQPADGAFHDLLRQCLDQGLDRLPPLGADIAAPGVVESAYDGSPIEPMLSLLEFLPGLSEDLPSIRCPVLILTSPQDHVVPPVSSDLLAERVSGPVERVTLERSYHVATLDYDGELVTSRAVEFGRRVISNRGVREGPTV